MSKNICIINSNKDYSSILRHKFYTKHAELYDIVKIIN